MIGGVGSGYGNRKSGKERGRTHLVHAVELEAVLLGLEVLPSVGRDRRLEVRLDRLVLLVEPVRAGRTNKIMSSPVSTRRLDMRGIRGTHWVMSGTRSLMTYTSCGISGRFRRFTTDNSERGERKHTVREGVDLDVLGVLLDPLQACERVDTFRHERRLVNDAVSPWAQPHPACGERKRAPPTINVHGAGSADSLSARATEGQGRVEFVLDLEDRVEDHRSALVHVDLVRLHVRLLGGLVRVLFHTHMCARAWPASAMRRLLDVTFPLGFGYLAFRSGTSLHSDSSEGWACEQAMAGAGQKPDSPRWTHPAVDGERLDALRLGFDGGRKCAHLRVDADPRGG